MADDEKVAIAVLAQKNDELICSSSFKKGKTPQIVAFGRRGRLYVMTPKKGGANLDFQSHILDLRKIKSPAPNKFQATFANGAVEGDFECNQLINSMRQMFYSTFIGAEMFSIEVDSEGRLSDLQEPAEKPCAGFADAYVAVCDWQGVPPRPELIWEINNIFPVSKKRVLELEDIDALKPTDFTSLVTTLAYNRYFTALSCSNITLDKNMAQAVGMMLVKNTTLEDLNLNNTGLTKGLIAPIADGIKNNKDCAIQMLDVSNNQLTDKDLPLLGTGLGSMQKGLINLNVANCGAKKGGAAALVNGFRKNLFLSGSIHTLNLSNNVFDNDGTVALSAFLAQPTGLQVLNLANCGIKIDQLFAALLRGCQSLEWLDITGNKMTKKDLSQVGQFLKAASHLKYIRMSNCGMDADMIKSVLVDISSNMYLNDLDLCLSENRVGAAGAKVIGPVLEKANGIKKLDISEMDLGPDGMQVLCTSLCANTGLEHLDISGNFVGKPPFDGAIESLCALIKSECPLNSLVLKGGKTGPLREAITPFLINLAMDESLQSLDISDNHFGMRGVLALGKALQTNKKLASLKWDGSDTPYPGFDRFVRSLALNTTLKHMPTPINDVSAAMRTNPAEMDTILSSMNALITRNSSPEMMAVFKEAGTGGGAGGSDTSFLLKGEVTQLKNLRNKVKALGRNLEGMEQVVMEDAEGNELGIADIYQQRETAVLAMKQELNEKLKALAFDILPVINNHMGDMQNRILDIVEKRYGSIDRDTRSRLRLNMQFGAKDVDPEEVGKIIMESTASQIIRRAEDSYQSAITISSDYIYEKLMESLQNVIDEVVVAQVPEKDEPVAPPEDDSFYPEEPATPEPTPTPEPVTPEPSPSPSPQLGRNSSAQEQRLSTGPPVVPRNQSSAGPAVPPKVPPKRMGSKTPLAAPPVAGPAAGLPAPMSDGATGESPTRGEPGVRRPRGAGPGRVRAAGPRGGGVAALSANLFGAGGPPMPGGMGMGPPRGGGMAAPPRRPPSGVHEPSGAAVPTPKARPPPKAAPAAQPSGDHSNLDMIEKVESNIDNSILKERVRGPPKRKPPTRTRAAAK